MNTKLKLDLKKKRNRQLMSVNNAARQMGVSISSLSKFERSDGQLNPVNHEKVMRWVYG